MSSTKRSAICFTGRTKSAVSAAMALRGMEGYSASSGGWTKTTPPPSLMALRRYRPEERLQRLQPARRRTNSDNMYCWLRGHAGNLQRESRKGTKPTHIYLIARVVRGD